MSESIKAIEDQYTEKVDTEETEEERIRLMVADELIADWDRWGELNPEQWKIAYRMIWLINHPEPKPQHPDDWERERIRDLKKTGLSMAQLGFVFNRSTQTIFSILNPNKH